jgi:hypothetical protein
LGDIFHKIFGGSSSKQKSESGNLAYPQITQDFGSSSGQFGDVTGSLGNILGLGTDDPLQSFYDKGGGDFLLNQGLDGLTNRYASLGLSRSGAAMKGMEKFREGLASTYLNDYLGHLSDLAKLDLGAGGLISDAGQYSKGSGKSDSETGNFGKFLGALMACDRRLKTNVERVATLPDGLPIYAFDYVEGHGLPEGRHAGPMADEVAEYQPWALGPEIEGYQTIIPALLNVEPDPAQVARFM